MRFLSAIISEDTVEGGNVIETLLAEEARSLRLNLI